MPPNPCGPMPNLLILANSSCSISDNSGSGFFSLRGRNRDSFANNALFSKRSELRYFMQD